MTAGNNCQMIINMSKEKLTELLEKQLNNFFISDNCGDKIYCIMDDVLNRVEKSFSAVNNKYYSKGGIHTFQLTIQSSMPYFYIICLMSCLNEAKLRKMIINLF